MEELNDKELQYKGMKNKGMGINGGSGKLPVMCCSIMTFAPSLQQWPQNNVKFDLTRPVSPTCKSAEVRSLSHFEDYCCIILK